MSSRIALASLLLSVASGQGIGTLTAEVHPPLTWQTCTAPGSCTTIAGKVVLDSNWRWLHSSTGTNCYTGNTWNPTFCPNNTACAQNCQLDGADYSGTYGATTSGNALRLNFVTNGANRNVGSRMFLMADDSNYQMLTVLNREFTFDVDVSHLPCGLNGALYLVSMAKDGGTSLYPNNKAGAKYGVGYCDAQCPRDLKFINGMANVEGWVPSSNNVNTGVGSHGSCCAEMDIWEANSISSAFTPHSADPTAQSMCTGDSCGGTYSSDRYAGVTDPDGCDFNSYRQGNKDFYGPGKTVNTNSVFTVVTQFITNTGTDAGTLSEIKRFYVQNGVVIPNSQSTIAGIPGNSLTDSFCKSQKTVFGDPDIYNRHGGFASMSTALKNGMVLSLSLWDDYAANMLWLDSTYPVTGDPATPGIGRGTCPTTSGVPAEVEASSPNSYVIYSNIKVGAINSTFNAGSVVTPPSSSSSTRVTSSTTLQTSTRTSTSSTTSSSAPASSGAGHWEQCGGQPPFAGPFTCQAPWVCTFSSIYYSQCL
ncbi:putative 1,4-beta-D-glucan cellobiohydrolase B [Leptodontidium sp. 2 PMI_412]|nr:glycoside hydrolase [Leptodontidium sp. MPI-SDFR-AT-0119]KAH9219424.1 putative 1,4-beta-D-glucan cellobiohydrolase B [Leptodontidium sp. 2 PMI_412]